MKIISVIVAAMAVSALAACGSDSTTSPSATTAGTYVLRTVNGSALPASVITLNGADTTIVTADTVVLNANLTYTRHSVDSVKSTGVAATLVSDLSAGTYVQTDTVITFTRTTDNGTSIPVANQTSLTGKLVNGVATVTETANGFTVTGVFDKQ